MAFTVDTSQFTGALRRLSLLNDKTGAENLQRYARSTLSNRQGTGLLELTPPAGSGATGPAAKRQGEAAIDRDLAAVFVPVRLKGKRRERWPDVAGIHAARDSSRHGGKHTTRGRAQAYYVDQAKLKALRRTLYSHVGALASGLIAACNRLGVRAPAYIARHGESRGTCTLQIAGALKEIEFVNNVPDDAPVAEVERRTKMAVEYATSRMEREIAHLVAKDARSAGFATSG